MRVARIRIENVMGVEELEFEPGTVTEVTGANGTGKSSVIAAMQAVMENAPTAELLRTGEKQGRVVWVLDNGVQIERRFREGTSVGELIVTDPDYGKVSKPQTYLTKLLGILNANPIEFVFADRKRRGELLLQALPMSITKPELDAAVAGAVLPPEIVIGNRHALDVLAAARELFYNARTGYNAIVKDKAALIEQLGDSVPKDAADPVNVDGQIEQLRAHFKKSQEQAAAEETRIRTELERQRTEVAAPFNEKIARLQAEIEKLRVQIGDLNVDRTAAIKDVEAAAQSEVHRVHDMLRVREAEIEQQTERLHAQAREQASTQRTLQIIKQATEEHDKASEKSDRCTAAIAGLDALKQEKLKALPLPGAEIRDGDIYFKGVVFHRLNMAMKFQVAIRLALKAAGDLPFICADGLSELDADTFETFKQEVAKVPGVQVILARPEAGIPLTVRTT